jgi:hypothetical protein
MDTLVLLVFLAQQLVAVVVVEQVVLELQLHLRKQDPAALDIPGHILV